MKNKFSMAFSLAVVMAMLVTSFALAAELVTAEVTATQNDVTVAQGTSVTSWISLSATGSIACAITSGSPSTATVDTTYSLNSAGVLTTGSPSSAFAFYSDGVSVGGPNCGITWNGASTPYSVEATFSAAATTPIGNYTVNLQDSSAGTTDTADVTNPSVSGGKLGDTAPTTIIVHVISGAVVKTTPTITWANPANIVYGTTLSSTQLNATASVPGTFAYTPAAGTMLNAGAGQTLHVDFTPTDTTNYNSASKDVMINVSQADALVTVNGYTGDYDGAVHGATGTATGVGGADLSAGLALGDSFTNVPGGTANWTFEGGANYLDENGSVQIVISQADATVNVVGYTGNYDGAAHGASGTATGVGGADLSAGLNFGATYTDVPGGNAHWTFEGGTNYLDESGDVTITINKAPVTATAGSGSSIYDGATHSPLACAVTGTYTGNLSCANNPASVGPDAGTTAIAPVVTGTGLSNFEINSVDGSYTIEKADASIVVTPYDVTYNGAAHTATGTATGVNSEDLSADLDLSGTAHTDAGTYSDTWTFTDSTGNYNNDSGTITNKIAQAPVTATAGGGSSTYDGATHAPSACAVTGTYTGDLSCANNPAAVGPNAGTTEIAPVVSGTGLGNFAVTSVNGSYTINKADASCTVTGYSVVYDGNPHTATGSCTGVGGSLDVLSGLDLSNTTHTLVGTYLNDLWTFTDVTGNYNDTNGTVNDYILAWTIKGFYQPVDMFGVLNTVKGGSTVPLKFEVFAGTTELTNTAIVSTLLKQVTCNAVAGEDTVEVLATGGTSLRYDAVGGQFIFNWQTPKLPGKCYSVTLTTQDGSSITALFKLK